MIHEKRDFKNSLEFPWRLKKEYVTHQNLTWHLTTANIIFCSSWFRKNKLIHQKSWQEFPTGAPAEEKVSIKTCYWGLASTEAPVRLNSPFKARKRSHTKKCAPSTKLPQSCSPFQGANWNHWFHISRQFCKKRINAVKKCTLIPKSK